MSEFKKVAAGIWQAEGVGTWVAPEAAPPKLWWLVKWLPIGLKLDLLEALAWPEFDVVRLKVVADSEHPSGISVERVPLEVWRRGRKG
jgi:hypothetical protein